MRHYNPFPRTNDNYLWTDAENSTTPKTSTGIRTAVKRQLFPSIRRASERLKLRLQPTLVEEDNVEVEEEEEEEEEIQNIESNSTMEVLHCGALADDNLYWEPMHPDCFREKELDELFNLSLVNALYRMYDEAKVDACYGCKNNKSSQKHHDICLLEDVPVHVIRHAAQMLDSSTLLRKWLDLVYISIEPPPNPLEISYMRNRVEQRLNSLKPDSEIFQSVLSLLKIRN